MAAQATAAALAWPSNRDGYAQNFLLYKLYSFSADFQSLAGKLP